MKRQKMSEKEKEDIVLKLEMERNMLQQNKKPEQVIPIKLD